MSTVFPRKSVVPMLLLALGWLAISLTGCATRSLARKPIFYPPAPEEPRIQYLTSFATSADIESPRGWLVTFLTGYKGETRPVLKPYGVTVASNKIFVCDTALNCLVVFDLERQTFSYLVPRGPGALAKPINADVDSEGALYVADPERLRVAKFDSQGNFLNAIAGDETFRPVDVIVRGNRIYAADTKGRRVRVFDRTSLKSLFSIPKSPEAPSRSTNAPAKTAVSRATNSATAARSNLPLKNAPVTPRRPAAAAGAITGAVVSSVGPTNSARQFGTRVTTNVSMATPARAAVKAAAPKGAPPSLLRAQSGDPSLYLPTNIDVDREGNIYVTDAAAFRIQIYDAEGRYIKSIGSQGNGFGQFARPKGVSVDRAGRMYVVDAAEQVVQIFDVKTGALLMYFGEPDGSEVPLSLPAGIHIDYDNLRYFKKYSDQNFEVEYLILVTTQLGSPRVNVYGFGHKVK